MSYNPYDPYNFNGYLHTETFNYTRNQPLNHLMSRPELVDYGRDHPDPMNQQMDQFYYHGNDQRGYNGQQALYVPQARPFDLNESRELPSNPVTATIRLSNRRFMNGLISRLERSYEWDVRAHGTDITVTGYSEYFGREGQNEFLARVQDISGDPNARLC
jgi:hypothetical protein